MRYLFYPIWGVIRIEVFAAFLFGSLGDLWAQAAAKRLTWASEKLSQNKKD